MSTRPPTVALGLGTRVLYKGAWGSDPAVPGTITGWGEKNGETVWDVHLDSGLDHWGYDYQFQIEERAP